MSRNSKNHAEHHTLAKVRKLAKKVARYTLANAQCLDSDAEEEDKEDERKKEDSNVKRKRKSPPPPKQSRKKRSSKK
ncbi:hypothetical protein R1flu_027652 [Riccia fluitans]|uniref:Uncharacterized protein n=1 Tax=Riccia fluitans TaxID=41844 RepID=A0ABD1XJG5_9MARC